MPSSEIKRFNSIGELLEFVDQKLEEYKKNLSNLLPEIEEIKAKAEQNRKVKALLTKFGVAQQEQQSLIEIHDIKIAINPLAEVEHKLKEELIENLNDKVTRLQTVKSDLEELVEEEIDAPVEVVIVDDIPKAILIKLQ